jgi:zinc protease
MRVVRYVFVLILVFILHSNCFAAPAVEKTILDNGLTTLVSPMPSSEVISIYAYVKTGSATEGQFSGAGISHFVEHMLFKGTAKRPVGSIAKEVKSLGGNINAATSLDYTIYTLDLPKGTFKEGLDIISDMLMNSAFDPQQVEKEREVIHGEMRLYNDRPERRLSEDVFRNVYIRHPYRHPIIGYRVVFDQITRENLHAYYKSKYIPNNIILSVAGAVDSAQVLPLIKQAFAGFKPLPFPERAIPVEPPQVSTRYLENFYATPLFRFSLAYQSVSLLDPDLFALDVLAMALGQGESSRLYTAIYKAKKLVNSIHCSNYTPTDKGVFEIEGVMVKDNLSQVREEIKTIIGNVQKQGLLPGELEKTKRQVLSQFVLALKLHRVWLTGWLVMRLSPETLNFPGIM